MIAKNDSLLNLLFYQEDRENNVIRNVAELLFDYIELHSRQPSTSQVLFYVMCLAYMNSYQTGLQVDKLFAIAQQVQYLF
jgi:hypothetical protein